MEQQASASGAQTGGVRMSNVRKLLMKGQFICPVTFESEYLWLCNPQNHLQVNAWLEAIDMQLARVHADGAFFCAPLTIESSDANKVRDDLKHFRDTYEPMVRMFNLVREAKHELVLVPGAFIQLAELEQAVNESPILESQLRAMVGLINKVSSRFSNREMLKRMLETMKDDGYLVLANVQNETYRVTGKIDHLHAVLEFIVEHTPIAEERPPEGVDHG
jgi:Mg2+ and Co2+ transporter CorA